MAAPNARSRPAGGGRSPAPPPRKPSSKPAPPPRAEIDIRVRILDGPSAGTEYAISGSVVRIGRGEDNDIVLPDSNASRNHAELVRDGNGRYVVRDLGSRNGIQVNRKKVPQAALANGDRILVGSTNMEFVSGGGAAAGSGTAARWIVVAALAGIVGFVVISLSGGGDSKKNRSGGGVVIAPVPGASAAATSTPVPGGAFSISGLLAESQKKPPTGPGGVEIGRNVTTKADVVAPKSTPADRAAAEKTIASIMAEGERLYFAGRLVEARAAYDKAVKLDPMCERCLNKYDIVDRQITKEIKESLEAGDKYLGIERWDAALQALERVQYLDPDPSSVNNANATRLIEEVNQRRKSGGR